MLSTTRSRSYTNDHYKYFNHDNSDDNGYDDHRKHPYSPATSCACCRSSIGKRMKNSLSECHCSNTTSTTFPPTTITTESLRDISADKSSWKEEAYWLAFQYEVTRFLKEVDRNDAGDETDEEILLETARRVIQNNRRIQTDSQSRMKEGKHGCLHKPTMHLKTHCEAVADASISPSSSIGSFSVLNTSIHQPQQQIHHHQKSAYHDSDDEKHHVYPQQRDSHHFEQHSTSTLQQQTLRKSPKHSTPSSFSLSSSQSKQKQQLIKQEHKKEEEELSKHIAELKLELAMLRAQRDEMEFDLWKGSH